MNKQKLVVVGAGGMVGATAAYACALRSVVEEIVLIDRNPDLAWGQAADITDGMGIDRCVVVRPGSYDDIKTDDIVVVTAGAPQQPGQTRLELLGVNAEIMRGTVRNIMRNGARPYILVVSNPVDALTYVALKESGLPKSRVFGTGTALDTSRLKSYIADELDVHSREVDAYILGEHGDSSFATIESAQVGEVPLADYPGFKPAMVDGIEEKIRQRAYRVIETKRSTYYAIGFVISKIVSALRSSSRSVYPVCSLVEGEYGLHDVVLGLPSTICADGVKILTGYPLNEREQAALRHSAKVVAEAIRSLE
ncbi:L-lactate dehydrogenase [Candidatus Saccharibacteria bacterium oral taxon 488]|nr:L-lactate dehydrogenase [Candidatus Saccharibacteria bacterium oral taxon 488]